MAAKEVFVAQMSIVYAVSEQDYDSLQDSELKPLQKKLQNDYSPLQGVCVMLFALISAPCIATVAITRQETGRWRWAMLQWFGLTGLAYLVTTIVYQVGCLLV